MGAKAALFICTNALVAGGQINVDTLAAVVKNQVALIPMYGLGGEHTCLFASKNKKRGCKGKKGKNCHAKST